MIRIITATTAALATLLAGTTFAAAQAKLAPHRAVYDLSLLKSSASGSAPTAATGRIVYDFSGSACEGYAVSFRQLTELTPSEGETHSSDMRSTSFESGDHKSFRFRIETLRDGQTVRTLEGAASRDGDGSLSIEVKSPTPMKADTPYEAVFPTDMMLRALAAAHEGASTVSVKVFDGSDTGDKVYETLSVIGRPSEQAVADPTKDVAPMKGMKRWPVKVSYFDLAKPDAPPAYILSFLMWDNGVSSDLVLDYGEFKLKGEMSKIDMLPVSDCAK